MQNINVSPSVLHPDGIALLRHVFDVACDTFRDQVTDTSRARIHGMVGLAIVDMAKSGHIDPDHLLQHALACARAALN